MNPALHTNCEALKEVIPGVVEETLCKSVAVKSTDTHIVSKKNLPLIICLNFVL